MNSPDGANDGYQTLLENSREQGSLMEGLLDGSLPPPKPPMAKLFSRLCRVKSAPPQDDLEHSSPLLARTKHLARAAASLPPPSPFHHDGVSTIFLAIIALGIYLLVGLLSFSLLDIELEGSATSSLVDALYFAIVTMTTVGYGDLVPRTAASKLFTCAFVFTGFGLVGVLVSGAANYLVEKQEMLLVQKIYLRHKRKEHKKQKEELAVEDEKHVVAAHWKMFIAGCAVVVHFIAGILALMCWEGLNFIDAFYVVCVTVTTLGYGDRSFLTQAGRIFAIIWILSSTVCVAQFFLYLAESRTEERQRDIASWALHRPTTPSDLEAADMDGDGVVSAAEFVIYKLKELGKIDQEDVRDIVKEFCALDYDESGTLNLSDIHIANLVNRT